GQGSCGAKPQYKSPIHAGDLGRAHIGAPLPVKVPVVQNHNTNPQFTLGIWAGRASVRPTVIVR
ncbi:MAG TPA: hypothetical protein V6C88_09465, partial [Chroococcidiopsis sp.]